MAKQRNDVTGNSVTVTTKGTDGVADLKVTSSNGEVQRFNAVSTHTHANKSILDGITEAPATATHTHDVATASEDGFMSSTDKAKLASCETHISQTNNPHNVTCDQLNAVKKSDYDTKMSELDTAIAAKAASTDVTAEATARSEGDTTTLSSAKTYTDTQIAGQSYITQTVVSSLPETGVTNVQYLVPVSGTTGKYSIHAWIDSAWVDLGTTEVDLSQYYKKTETDTLLAGKSDTSHTHAEATSSASGFMSSTDKTKIDAYSTQTLVFTLEDGKTVNLNAVVSS